MVMIRHFFVSTLPRESILRKTSYDITAMELLALCADNILHYAYTLEMDACYLEKAE